MSSRRYPTAELYEERERDFYRGNNRSSRNYEELDVELRRGANPRSSAPDFFREDYNRPTAGPMVVRGRDEDTFSRAGPRSSRGGFDDDVRSVRSSRAPPPPSSVRDHDAPVRRGTRDFERDETDIRISRREQSRPREPELRAVEREDIIFRRGDGPRQGPREVEHDDVRFRGRGRGDDIDIHASRSEVSRHGRDVSVERGSIRFQERDGNFDIRANRREFSRDGRDTSRERSSLTIRGRERSLPPPRSRGELVAREHEEFTIRRRDTSPQPREIIKDEIIIRRKEERMPTPSPSPSPPPPPPPQLEPEIRPPIIQEIITHHRHIDHGLSRSRGPGRGREYEDLSLEIDINRENGEFNVKPRKKDMWTEVTKDLVLREAIDQMGYSCEETDDFFYIMEYLQYEDVLQLVELSDELRRKHKLRIDFERTTIRDPPRSSKYDEKFYEREVSYDSRRSRGGYR
ncbi:hypothetical protein EK21DRAFT_100061 [Setomelanomma holmii]|uniref:DUF8035 domain-containing protein n=1 Tax=Setomelanomma holmii TaxID=210430 RepID=A0A9P4HC66_9PLEO|nr:hypothetical protein EK21DRAFT_100061 [Setomelanomma holmii]